MEISKKIENWLLNNIGGIGIIFGLLIIEIYLLNFLNIKTITLQSTITTIGAIFAFWYSYKKYERNKEIELLNYIIEGKFSANNFNLIPWNILYKMKELNYIRKEFYNIIDKDNKYRLRVNFRKLLNKKDLNIEKNDGEKFLNLFSELNSMDIKFRKKIMKIILDLEKDEKLNEQGKKLLKQVKDIVKSVKTKN